MPVTEQGIPSGPVHVSASAPSADTQDKDLLSFHSLHRYHLCFLFAHINVLNRKTSIDQYIYNTFIKHGQKYEFVFDSKAQIEVVQVAKYKFTEHCLIFTSLPLNVEHRWRFLHLRNRSNKTSLN